MNKANKILVSIALSIFLLSITLESSAQLPENPETLNWYQDYDNAKREAITDGKIVMLYFSGSDWCKPCIQLNQNILESSTFTKYAAGNFVPVKLDFPKMKKNRHSKDITVHNEALAEKYNPNGVFPLLVFLDENEQMIGFTGYSELSPNAYVAVIDKIIQQ